MILKLKYEEVENTGARGEVDGKKVNFYMRVEVNEMNIEEAIEKFNSNRWVVALEYTGEPSFLSTLELKDKPVIITKKVDDLDMNIDFIMNEVDSKVRVLFELPKDFKDMRKVYDYSQKYPNSRYSGGKLLRLEGCNVGGIGQEDLHKKIPPSRVAIITEGSACIMPTLTLEEVDEIEFYEAKGTGARKTRKPTTTKAKSKTSRTRKPKKQLSSLLSLTNPESIDNF